MYESNRVPPSRPSVHVPGPNDGTKQPAAVEEMMWLEKVLTEAIQALSDLEIRLADVMEPIGGDKEATQLEADRLPSSAHAAALYSRRKDAERILFRINSIMRRLEV